MLTSIIIVNYNTLDYLKACVESVKKYTKDYELIIIDNGSNSPKTDRFIKKEASKYVINKLNNGFARANNQGAKLAKGELLCFLNSDTIVTDKWLIELKRTMKKSDKCVAVGPLGNPRYKEVGGVIYEYKQYEGQFGADVRVGFLSGFCLLIQKKVFDLTGFDEDFKLGLFEDNLLCEKIKKLEFEMWVSHKSLVHHFGSASFIANNINYIRLLKKNQKVFDKKMRELNGK